VKHAYTDSKRRNSSTNVGVAGTNSGNSDNCPRSGRVLMIGINPFVIRLYVYRPFHNLRYVKLAILRHISPVQCVRSLLGLNPWTRASCRRPDVADAWPISRSESCILQLLRNAASFRSFPIIENFSLSFSLSLSLSNLERVNFPRTVAPIIIDIGLKFGRRRARLNLRRL